MSSTQATEDHDESIQAVMFDFFGTIARHPDGAISGFSAVFTRHGYRLDPEIEASYFARYDGVEHLEHSTDQATYEVWVRFRHAELARDCEVAPHDVDRLVDALRALDASPVVAYPDAAPTLRELRSRGIRIGVCSNWGWGLETALAEAGLLELVDAAVTSARAGARKPHPRIFETVSETLGVRPRCALFVGDSLRPDVMGPMGVGMQAVHLWRPEDRSGVSPPDLPPGARRVTTLVEILDWPVLRGAPPGVTPGSR